MSNVDKKSPEFIEEESKLKKLVDKISFMLNNYKQFLPYPRVGEYATSTDYDDAEDLQYKKRANNFFYDSTIVPWKERIYCPYYGRIDLEINGDYKVVYIGEKDLLDQNGNNVVFSGYSEVGRFFAQRSLERDTNNGNKYEAFLRRNLLIEGGKLKLVDDVFIKGLDIKYNGITDPYLMEVLKRNRRETRMYSILSSIQENQFNIVNQLVKSSFVVQGCAGSGKTAILFQRLASIEYRYPGYIDDKVRFITPNLEFNTFVGPLAKSLGLTNIRPITMLDYYLELLNRYKISIPVKREEIESDYKLDSNFIRDVYSDSTIYNNLFPNGQIYIDEVLKEVDYDKLTDCLVYFDIEKPNPKFRYTLPRITSYLTKAAEYLEDNVVKRVKDVLDKA